MSSFASSSAHFNPGTSNPRFAQLFDDPSYMAIQAARSILIDSRDRDITKYPNPSEYVIDLPTIYKNVTSARLVSAELPSSYYVFSSSKGNTTLKINISSPALSRSITIPDGNYGLANLEVVLQSAINAAFSNDGVTFEVAVDRTTYKMTITCSNASKIVGIDTTGQSLAYYLGFKSGGTGTGFVVGSGVVSLNPETYILISIDPLDRVDEAGANGGGDRVFAKIPISVNSFDVAMYDKQLTCNTILPPIAKLDKMRVRMRFHGSSSLIDFNGADHSLTIELQCSQTR